MFLMICMDLICLSNPSIFVFCYDFLCFFSNLMSFTMLSYIIFLIWFFLESSTVLSGEFGDITVTNSFLLWHALTMLFYFSFSLMIYMHYPQGWHAFIRIPTSFLPYVLHVFTSWLTHFSYLFKPVVRQLYSLAFH